MSTPNSKLRTPHPQHIDVDWRSPPTRTRRNPAQCRMCGLTAGNSSGIKVLRYPLLRRVNPPRRRQTSVCIGSIGLCDRCVIEHGDLNERARTK